MGKTNRHPLGQNDGVTIPTSPYAPEPDAAKPAAKKPAAAKTAAKVSTPAAAAAPAEAAPSVVAPNFGIDRTAVIFTTVMAVVLLVAAVVNFIAGQNFPSNAPVEQLYAFGITVDLLAGGIALGARLLFIARIPRATAPVVGPGGLAIASAVLGVAVVVGWLLAGGGDFLGKLAGSGFGLRYYLDVTGAFFFGIPWILGIFFGVAGYRTGKGPVNAVLSFVGLGLGLLILLASLYSAVVYGLGLSN